MTDNRELTGMELEQVRGGISLISPAVQTVRKAANDSSSDTTTSQNLWLEVFTCPDDGND